jgi:serine/threonine protein kinase
MTKLGLALPICEGEITGHHFKDGPSLGRGAFAQVNEFTQRIAGGRITRKIAGKMFGKGLASSKKTLQEFKTSLVNEKGVLGQVWKMGHDDVLVDNVLGADACVFICKNEVPSGSLFSTPSCTPPPSADFFGSPFLDEIIAVEYLNKGDLSQWVNLHDSDDNIDSPSGKARDIVKRSLTANMKMHIFINIVKGVKALYSQGIVHRDLKDANVFLNLGSKQVPKGQVPKGSIAINGKEVYNEHITVSNGEHITDDILRASHLDVKLGDFGLAVNYKTASEAVCVSEAVGTPIYTAPELFPDHANPPRKKCEELGNCCKTLPPVDVWSLGVLLFAMILDGWYPSDPYVERTELSSNVIREILADNEFWRPDFTRECRKIERNHTKVDFTSDNWQHPTLPTVTKLGGDVVEKFCEGAAEFLESILKLNPAERLGVEETEDGVGRM